MSGRSLVLMHTISAPGLQSLRFCSGGISMEVGRSTRYPHPGSATQQFPGLLDLHVPHMAGDIFDTLSRGPSHPDNSWNRRLSRCMVGSLRE